ncbi:MAG: zinc-binding dehydrogenase [Caldilineaceae bacterium]|nr:zinc-binding dehydrogenase [Caldilineaceae bacterium]
MRATQVIAPGQIAVIETPKPELRPGYALIRTKQVSLCGSDYHAIYFSEAHEYPLPPGMSGHEVVGIVEEIDAPGSGIKVGDQVLTLIRTNRGMADYCLVAASDLLPLPTSKPLDQLLQAQQLGTVLYAAKHLPTSVIAKTVAVIGQGSAGLWWNYTLRRLGARRVIAVDLQAHRLAVSKHYGATDTVHNAEIDAVRAVSDLTGGEMVDLVVEAAGEADTIPLAVELVKRHGAILFFGVPRLTTVEFPFATFFRKCLLSRAIVGALTDPNHECTRMALDLIAKGEADVGPMITHHFPFEQVIEAYELQTTRDEGAIKIVVDLA